MTVRSEVISGFGFGTCQFDELERLTFFMGATEREEQSSPAAGGVDFVRGAHHVHLAVAQLAGSRISSRFNLNFQAI